MTTINDIINNSPALREAFEAITPVQPRWRYFGKKNANRYFWTTERMNHKGKPKFVSGVYKLKKSDGSLTPTRLVGHVKRKDAKTRARKLYGQRYSISI